VDRAERWRGERDEDARVFCDGGGDALAASEPGADELVGVGRYTSAQGGQREARRVLQAIGRTPPGSWTVV